MELTKNNSCHSQLSYNVERNIVRQLALAGKETEKSQRIGFLQLII